MINNNIFFFIFLFCRFYVGLIYIILYECIVLMLKITLLNKLIITYKFILLSFKLKLKIINFFFVF